MYFPNSKVYNALQKKERKEKQQTDQTRMAK